MEYHFKNCLFGYGFPTMNIFRKAAQAIANMVPHGTYRVLSGPNHDVKAEVIAPVLSEFYAGGREL